jgi:putative hydrolase of the HAD superfamily
VSLEVEGVLLDVDDTLVDTRGAFRDALAAIAAQYLPHQPPEAVDAMLRYWRADADGHFAAFVRGETDHRTQHMARANGVHREFGGPVLDDDAYDAWDHVFQLGFVTGWRAHSDARPVIDTLTRLGIPFAAVTNAPVVSQKGKLDLTGLGDVEVLVGVDTLGHGKPSADVFLEGCARLGTDPSRTWYVGDDLDIDARGARDAGLLGVWLDRPGGRRVPVDDVEVQRSGLPVITSLDQLPALLGIDALVQQ